MASIILPAIYCPVRNLPPMSQAQFRIACDSGKFDKALRFLPPASRPNAAVEIWESLPQAMRPGFIADLLNGCAGTLTTSAMLAGFIAQALRKLAEFGQTVTDCASSLRSLRALPPVVIAWRAAESGDLPGAGLIWHLRRERAAAEAQGMWLDGVDGVLYAVRVPRPHVAGFLRGGRILIQPCHATGAEAIGPDVGELVS